MSTAEDLSIYLQREKLQNDLQSEYFVFLYGLKAFCGLLFEVISCGRFMENVFSYRPGHKTIDMAWQPQICSVLENWKPETNLNRPKAEKFANKTLDTPLFSSVSVSVEAQFISNWTH